MIRKKCCDCNYLFLPSKWESNRLRCNDCKKIWDSRDLDECAREQKQALQAIRDDWDAEDAKNERLRMNTKEKLTPELMVTAKILGKVIEDSLLVYDCHESQGVLIAIECLQSNITPFEFSEMYDMVANKRCKKSARMLAEFKSMPNCSYEFTQRDGDGSILILTENGKEHTFSCIWEEVKVEPFTKTKNGELKDNYATPRKRMQMLSARVISDAIRVIAPEINAGLYTPEEMEDLAEDIPTNTKSEPKISDFVNSTDKLIIGDENLDGKGIDFDKRLEKNQKSDLEEEKKETIRKLDADIEAKKVESKKEMEEKAKLKNKQSDLDLSVIPVGKQKGEKWTEMPLANLKAALRVVGEGNKISEDYRSFIEAEIEAKS